MRLRIAVLALIVLALLCGCDGNLPLFDQSWVRVVVHDTSGQGVEGVTVIAYTGDSPSRKVTKPDGSETFWLRDRDQYRVVIEPPMGSRCAKSCEQMASANSEAVFVIEALAAPTATPTCKPTLQVETATATVPKTGTPTPTSTPSATATHTAAPTLHVVTPTNTATPVQIVTPSVTASRTATRTPTAVSTATPVPSVTGTPTEVGTATPTSEPTAGADCYTFQSFSWREALSIVDTAANLCCDSGPLVDRRHDMTLIHGLDDLGLGAPVTPIFEVTGDQGETITCRGFATGIIAMRPCPAHCVGYGFVNWDRVVNAEPPTPTPTPTLPDTTWSHLFYANGDNNLAYYVERAMRNLTATPAPIAVYGVIDCAGQGDTATFGPEGLTPVGEWNMGDGQSLKNTLAWAERYRTAYRVLHLFNHGSADGCLYDDTSGKDYLTPGELERALEGHHFEIIILDMCLGASIEMLYTLAPFCDYVVASEHLGWSVVAIERYAAVEGDARERAIAIAEAYFLHEKLDGYPRTMAVFDMSQIEPVMDVVAKLAVCDLYYARQIVQRVDSDEPFNRIDLDDRLVDLYWLCYVCGMDTAPLGDFVVLSLAESGVSDGKKQVLDRCFGASIYVPSEIDRRARDHADAYGAFHARAGDVLTRIPAALDIERMSGGGEIVIPPMGNPD